MAKGADYDVAIIGGGIAGLSVALNLPETMRVILFTKGQLGESNTRYAQGGLAVAMGADDSPQLHYEDTLAAGAGLCDRVAVRLLVEEAPGAVRWLMQMGVEFDRAEEGSESHTTEDGLLLGREAAHSRWRVLHAGGDATGAEIERALLHALAQRTSITLYEKTSVTELITHDRACVGVRAIDRDGKSLAIEAQSIVLANGGAGGLWLHTSNPAGATADGLALAWQAGAALADLEFMQFHPTVLLTGETSSLISEAVRGEGAYLRNHAGERFMLRYAPQAELAPRDVVARAILSEMLAEGTNCEYLDLRHLPAEKMRARFPTISAICRKQGLDLARDLLPVAPAAHYCMGGVLVDMYGRTTVPGLYAVGEVACTGAHGANRLASNSLLEGLVFGRRTAAGLALGYMNDQPRARHMLAVAVDAELWHNADEATPDAGAQTIEQVSRAARNIMWQYVSLRREEQGLRTALRRIQALRAVRQNVSESGAVNDGAEPRRYYARWTEVQNMLLVAELVILAALQRRESRGSHWREDWEATNPALDETSYALYPALTGVAGATTAAERATTQPQDRPRSYASGNTSLHREANELAAKEALPHA